MLVKFSTFLLIATCSAVEHQRPNVVNAIDQKILAGVVNAVDHTQTKTLKIVTQQAETPSEEDKSPSVTEVPVITVTKTAPVITVNVTESPHLVYQTVRVTRVVKEVETTTQRSTETVTKPNEWLQSFKKLQLVVSNALEATSATSHHESSTLTLSSLKFNSNTDGYNSTDHRTAGKVKQEKSAGNVKEVLNMKNPPNKIEIVPQFQQHTTEAATEPLVYLKPKINWNTVTLTLETQITSEADPLKTSEASSFNFEKKQDENSIQYLERIYARLKEIVTLQQLPAIIQGTSSSREASAESLEPISTSIESFSVPSTLIQDYTQGLSQTSANLTFLVTDRRSRTGYLVPSREFSNDKDEATLQLYKKFFPFRLFSSNASPLSVQITVAVSCSCLVVLLTL